MSFVGRLPIVKNYKNKINDRFTKINNEILQLANENIELRLKLKKVLNEKINIVFICHRPAVWGSLKTVYEAMKQDSAFDVKIVTIPNKKQLPKLGLAHEIYESEGAEEFWQGDNVISGYNFKTKEWIDLKNLKPDYIFFQRPYNIERCPNYKSWEVMKYAKLCYVEYGYNTNHKLAIECLPKDFIKNVSLFFLQNNTEFEWYKNYFNSINNNFTRMYVTGFPRFDGVTKYINSESNLWKNKHEGRFRIIWTPRWTTNENNCNFFNYKDKLLNYCIEHQNTIDFVFRPHPQAFLNWKAEGEMNDLEIKELKEIYKNSKNMIIDDSKEYLSTFYSADCLISDYSSIVPEFFLTGKPVIYCTNDKSIFTIEGNILKGFYVVKNWEELSNTINFLMKGIDPLKEKRMELIKNEFHLDNINSGTKIKEIIKNDFMNI